jgi:hypothetical protein
LEQASNNHGKKKDSLHLLVHYQIAAWEQKKEVRNEWNGEDLLRLLASWKSHPNLFLGGFHFSVHFSCCTERILQQEDCRKREIMSRDLLQSPLSTSQSVMFWRLVISSSLSTVHTLLCLESCCDHLSSINIAKCCLQERCDHLSSFNTTKLCFGDL